MSWNEWKTARASHCVTLFWLYLVGNLRADLAHAAPFVRAINDPFGSLVADEVTSSGPPGGAAARPRVHRGRAPRPRREHASVRRVSTQLCGIRGLARQLAKPVEPLVSSQPGRRCVRWDCRSSSS